MIRGLPPLAGFTLGVLARWFCQRSVFSLAFDPVFARSDASVLFFDGVAQGSLSVLGVEFETLERFLFSDSLSLGELMGTLMFAKSLSRPGVEVPFGFFDLGFSSCSRSSLFGF